MDIEWALVLFSLIGGAGGAVLAFAGIGEFVNPVNGKERMKIVIAAMVLMAVGGICATFHLQAPANFMAVLPHLLSFSAISIEALLMMGLFACAIGYLVGITKENAGLTKGFGAACIVLGFMFAFFSGEGYMIEAREGWNSIFVPLSYFASSLAAGGFIYVGLNSEVEVQKAIGMTILVLGVLAAAFSAGYGMHTSGIVDSTGLAYAGIAVAGGVVAAVAGYFVAFKQQTGVWVWVGLAGALVCGLCVRMLMWTAGVGFFDAFDLAVNARGLYMP